MIKMRTFLLLCILFSVAFSKLLVYKGGSGCTPSSPCDKCEGDCDSDADCKGTFKCYQRSYSTNPVPGCEVGGSGDRGSIDYCYEPCPDGSEVSAIGCRGTLASVLASTSETCGITDGSLDIFVNTAIAANEIYDMQSSDFTAKTLTTTAAQINGKLRANSISVTGDIEAGSLTGEIVTGNNIKDNSIDMTKVKGLSSYNRYQHNQAGSNPVYDKTGYLNINNVNYWPSAVIFDQDYTDVKRLRADLVKTPDVQADKAKIGHIELTNSLGMNIIDGGHDNQGARIYVGQSTDYGGGIKYNPSNTDDGFYIFRHKGSATDHTLIKWPHGDWTTAHFRAGIKAESGEVYGKTLKAGNELYAADTAFRVLDNNIYNGYSCTVALSGWIRIKSSPTGTQSKSADGRFGVDNWIYYIRDSSNGKEVRNHGGWKTHRISIDADGAIFSATYIGASDERIKKDIRPLKDNESLNIIRQLDAKVYKYKDEIQRGPSEVIGFIAQDVNKTIPAAVNVMSKVIPNEMRVIKVSYKNTTSDLPDADESWEMTLNEELAPGTYKFIFETLKDHIEEEEELTTKDGKTFQLKKQYKDDVFLYGKQVDDFLSIDKQKIFAVAYSALQQVDKNQQILQQKVATLEDTIAKLTARLDALEAK